MGETWKWPIRDGLDERISRIPMLGAVSRASLREVRPYISIRLYERNASIWSRGRSAGEFSFVLEGRVKLVKRHPTGKETILDFLGPGRLLCANVPYTCGRLCCAAIADQDDTAVLSILRQHFLELLVRHPLMMHSFLEELGCRTVVLCSRVEELGIGKVDQRIARLLTRLADQLGIPAGPEGIWIPMSLSRKDLAELCGTSVESAIRVMSRFEKEGLVSTRTEGFQVRDQRALSQLADGGVPSSRSGR